jgi:hypothetical protein
MKKIIFLLPLLILACNSIIPTPIPTFNDFPPPPPTYLTGIALTPRMTTIVEFPQETSTPTYEPRPSLNLQPNTLDDARTFLLILKTQVAAGDTYGFAEKVRYPIQVKVNGSLKTISTRDEFLENEKSILNDKFISALNLADENKVVIMPEGFRVGNGELWINQFCMDAACSDTEFFITQINN